MSDPTEKVKGRKIKKNKRPLLTPNQPKLETTVMPNAKINSEPPSRAGHKNQCKPNVQGCIGIQRKWVTFQ
jgi:hypothetical protein